MSETQQTITADEGAGKRQYGRCHISCRRTCTHVLLQETGGIHRDMLDLLLHKVQNTIEKHHRYKIPESSGCMLTAITIP